MANPHDDPYHDDDSVDMNIGKPSDSAPLLSTFKHVGDTLMNGGFCTPKKDRGKKEEMQAEQNQAEEKSTGTKIADTTIDTTIDASLSDESHHGVLDKDVSVSSPDEPLIVNDLEIPDDGIVKPETKPVNQEKSSIPMEASDELKETKQEAAKPSSKAVPSFIVLVALAAALYQFFNDEYLKPAVQKLFSSLQPHLIMFQMRVEDATGVEMHQVISGIAGSMIFLFAMKGIFASEKRLKASIEFVWGVLVCSIVMSGMYFTYDLASN